MPDLQELESKLRDARSGKVVFLSHCLLNVNTRYLGGACHNGSVPAIIEEYGRMGCGFVQMPCPEQLAWGGVLKRYLWLSLGSKGTLLYNFRGLLFPLFLTMSRMVFRRLARQVAHQVADYHASGYEVVGIIGIDGSPTCGVKCRLDLPCSFDFFASLSMETLDRHAMNKGLYGSCLKDGPGLFFTEIDRQLAKPGLRLPRLSYNLVEELREAGQL